MSPFRAQPGFALSLRHTGEQIGDLARRATTTPRSAVVGRRDAAPRRGATADPPATAASVWRHPRP